MQRWYSRLTWILLIFIFWSTWAQADVTTNPETSGVGSNSSGSGSSSFSAITSATTSTTINNGAFSQIWQWLSLGTGNALSLTASVSSGKTFSATATGAAANTGYAGYFENTSTNGYGIYVNGVARITNSLYLSNQTTGYVQTNGAGLLSSAAALTVTGDISINGSGVSQVIGIAGTPVASVTGTGTVAVLNVSPNFATSFSLGGVMLASAAVPTIASGFGTGASITTGTTPSFLVNVGTGGTAHNGVLAMNSTSTNGWNCSIVNQSNPGIAAAHAFSSTITAVSVQNYALATQTTAAWTASDILAVKCTPR